MDENKEIRRAIESGTVVFGEKQAEKNILNGIGKLIILSENIEKKHKEKIQHIAKLAGIPFYEFKGSSIELGSICGKPFPISMCLVLLPGKSKIIEIARKAE